MNPTPAGHLDSPPEDLRAASRAPARGGSCGMKNHGDVVRGVLAERAGLSTPLGPFLSLAQLTAYSSLSVRTLRHYLRDPVHPLPHYRSPGGGKVLVSMPEFDLWFAEYRELGSDDVKRVVSDVVARLSRAGRTS